MVVDVVRSGVNFADTHQTRNDYLSGQELPLIPGTEVVGTIADGRRVVALTGTGGYAEKVVVPEAMLIPVPDEVDDDRRRGAGPGPDRDGAGQTHGADRAGGDDRDRGRRGRHRPLAVPRQNAKCFFRRP